MEDPWFISQCAVPIAAYDWSRMGEMIPHQWAAPLAGRRFAWTEADAGVNIDCHPRQRLANLLLAPGGDLAVLK